ncbi:hypothetical protein BKA66DRAFT_586603 [Pyrenochaeta sp. MPI-SDFR-AT-0127]|nr:hypothetical protein BKA66DRAFT_586603 [Pyrenochaeta sp. MPI-SDFR-AT-0127]
MAARDRKHPAVPNSNLVDLSDFEENYSLTEEETTQRNFTNRRLLQAINYITKEGGSDSPALFINRVDRIHEALLQHLPQAGGGFDLKLYQHPQTLVREVRRNFEDAGNEEPIFVENSKDKLSELYTPSAVEHARYKEMDEVEEPLHTPSGAPLWPKGRKSDDNVPRQREFKYGGPTNEIENWFRDFPASLPFPETLEMAHWESLKIDFDLTYSAKKVDAGIVETNVPFDHPRLQQYKNLPLYDSGSRFKLPLPNSEDEGRIKQLGTEHKLENAVDMFNEGEGAEATTDDYAPRQFLEKFIVRRQMSPTAIRRSINITPTKPRQPINIKTATSARHAKGRFFARMLTSPDGESLTADDSSSANDTESSNLCEESGGTRKRLPLFHDWGTPVARRISDHRAEAIRMSSRRESNTPVSKPTPSRKSAPNRAILKKGSRGHLATAPNAKTPKPAVNIVDTPKAFSKRKRSISSQEYTPDGKRKRSVGSLDYTPSALIKKTRSSVTKKVNFAIPADSSDEEDVLDFIVPTATKLRKATPKKPASKVSKATAAGRQAKMTTSKISVTESEHEDSVLKDLEEVASEDEKEGRMKLRSSGKL